ncbi:MAG: sulfotransferase [Bacteroidales bacterium]|nr:sulfotransferase [Bacteroidales bacterium]MCF8332527.1 sulfotransferase [Bacteroidales bacterium]
MQRQYLFKELFRPLISALGERKLNRVFFQNPIIIGGCARSGTTLLMSILSAHDKIFAFPSEIGAFNQWKKSPNGVYPARIDRLYRHVLTHRIPSQTTRFCTKAPSNIRHIPEIMSYFNEKVKFIHIVRDARDVLLSKHPDSPEKKWVSPERWIGDVSKGLAHKNHPCVYTLKYEDLILNYENMMKDLLGFLDLEYTNDIHYWHNNTDIRKSNALFENEISSLHPQSIGKWKRPEYNKEVENIMNNQQIVALLKELDYL